MTKKKDQQTIFQVLGIDDLPPKQKAQITEELNREVGQIVVSTILQSLPPEDLNELDEITHSNSNRISLSNNRKPKRTRINKRIIFKNKRI